MVARYTGFRIRTGLHPELHLHAGRRNHAKQSAAAMEHPSPSEWRWLIVAIPRWSGTEVGRLVSAPFGLPGLPIASAFGIDAGGAVLGAGGLASRHHRRFLAATVGA